jgi:hypothetical protein
VGGGAAMRALTLFRSGALALALALVAQACTPAVTATHVEKGEPVTTGNATFDSFFSEVAEAKAEADKVGRDAGEAQRPLNDVVGSQSQGAAAPDAVRTEAKKLQSSGTLLHLDILPEAKVVASSKPDGASQKVLDAAEKTAKESLAVVKRATDLLVRVADLEKRRAQLVSSAQSSFSNEKQRGEVTRELAAAENVLKAARESGEKHGGAASKLVLDLALALETGAGSGAVASTKKPVKVGGPRPGGTGVVAAPAKPKGDDFDK